MRLHRALEHIRSSRFRSMEPWGAGETENMARYIRSHAAETIEFTFDFFDPADTGNTLQTFIGFADELWDNEIAPIPHNFFWVSWVQRILDENVRMAAFCERVHSPTDQSVIGLSVKRFRDLVKRYTDWIKTTKCGEAEREGQAPYAIEAPIVLDKQTCARQAG